MERGQRIKPSDGNVPQASVPHALTIANIDGEARMNRPLIELLKSEELPDWFSYPPEFVAAADRLDEVLDGWYVLTGEDLRFFMQGLKDRYPSRSLVPAIRSGSSDDIICWDRDQPGKVVVVHDFASAGWEDRGSYASLASWLKQVAGLDLEKLAAE